MAAHVGEHISVVMQFIASICWMIGALLMTLSTTWDCFHFAAAIAWFLANVGSAWALGWFDPATYGATKTGGGGKGSGVQLNGISTNGSSDEMKSKQPAPAV